jgi:hypothetical protein
MGTHCEYWLSEVRRKLAPTDATLETARARRQEVLDCAAKFDGVLRVYASGSIAHLTANDDTDADCGIVLDRRAHPKLGPDGDGEGPNDIIEEVRVHLRDRMQGKHPAIAFRVTRRAIRVTYGEPLAGGTDPVVEVIVALTRNAGALWIPNKARDAWDPSDPEKHTELLMGGGSSLRRTRTRTVRTAKGWNKQYVEPGLCSFNLEALGLSAINEEGPLAEALHRLFEYSADDLAERRTPDPAGVSMPIKPLIDRDVVVDRLRGAAELMRKALDADADGDFDGVQTALADLFWRYIDPPPTATSKAAFANALRNGNGQIRVSQGIALGGAGVALKTTRAFGGTYP